MFAKSLFDSAWMTAEHSIHVPWAFCSNNGDVLRDAAIGGRGIVLLPTFIVGTPLRNGSLRRILSNHQVPEMAVYALYPPTRHIPIKLRVFIDFLVARFASGSIEDGPERRNGAEAAPASHPAWRHRGASHGGGAADNGLPA